MKSRTKICAQAVHNVHRFAFLYALGREAADFRLSALSVVRVRRLVGTAERTRPPQAAAECAGAVRTDAPGAPPTSMEAEVGRFEPLICVCDGK